MGKELKRVPINFDWEIGKTWCGYINPHEVHKCKNCDGSGYSDEYYKLRDEWYGDPTKENYIPNPFRKNCIYNTNAWKNNLNEDDVNALLENDRLWDFTRVPINDEQKEIVKQKIANGENSWLPFNNGYIPTPQEVNEWNLKTLGHDSMNAWYCIKARLKLKEEIGKDFDPFDLICHVAYEAKPLTRKERANNVKKRNYFTKYGEKAQSVIKSLLDKYADDDLLTIESLDVLKLDPLNKLGSPLEIINAFGGKENYIQALKELENELYKVA